MKPIVLIALTGLASSVSAQTASWTLIGGLTADGDSVIEEALGETSATLRFALDMEPGPGGTLPDGSVVKGLGSVIAEFIGDSNWQGGNVTWTVNPDLTFLTGDLTEKGGAGYGPQDLHEVNAGQIPGFGTFFSDDPMAIIDINWDVLGDYSLRDVSVEASAEGSDTIQVYVRAPGASFDTPVDYSLEPSTVRFSVEPIPAPGSLALLGLGAATALRRRRA